MNPVKFEGQNCTHTAPGCMDLPTKREYNEYFQTEQVTSCWELSDEEIVSILKQIQAGERAKVLLTVVGGQPPVRLESREKKKSWETELDGRFRKE